jgi:hypothetical protein
MRLARPGRARSILLIIVAIAALLAVLLGVEVYRSATATPNVDTDYASMLEDLARSVQGDGPNRWDEYIAAVEGADGALMAFAGESVESADNWPEFLGKDGVSGVLSTVTELQTMLADADVDGGHDSALSAEEERAALRDASARMSAWLRGPGRGALTPLLALPRREGHLVRQFPRGEMLIYTLLPELRACRHSAQALRALMVVAADEGDWDTYTDAFAAMVWLAGGLSAEPVIISNLVGSAVAALGMEQVQQDVLAGHVPTETLPVLRAILDRARPSDPAHGLRGERLSAMDAVQHVHDDRGRLILSKLDELSGSVDGLPSIANVASIVMPRRSEAERVINWFYDRYLGMNEGKPPAGLSGDMGIDAGLSSLSWRHPLPKLIVPALGSYFRVGRQEQLQRLGLRTLLAIEQHRLDRGVLPGTLDELVPAYLDAVPGDPFASAGRALTYRVLAEPDEQGRGYILYSVGFDGVDNGGAINPKGWIGALNLGGEGTDAVLSSEGR